MEKDGQTDMAISTQLVWLRIYRLYGACETSFNALQTPWQNYITLCKGIMGFLDNAQ